MMSKTAPPSIRGGRTSGPAKGEHTWPKFVIGTIAGVGATVLAAVIGGSQNVNIFNGIAPVPTTTVTATATATATETVTQPVADGTLPPTSAGADTAGAVSWHSPVQLPDGYRLDLDDTGPAPKTFNSDADLVGAHSSEHLPLIAENRGRTRFGTVNSASATKAQCSEAIGIAATAPPVVASTGKTICILTDAEVTPHLAAVRLVRWEKDNNVMHLDVTVWVA